jgi:signal peptidase II
MIYFNLVFLLTFLLDLFTKILVRQHMAIGAEIKLAPFFSLTHIKNTGVAFGLLQGQNTLLAIFGFCVMGALLWSSARAIKENRWVAVVMGLVAAGAAGNLLDRVVYGQVTDFLDFYWGVHHWPAFNVADSAICVGAGLLILQTLRKS